MSTKKPKLLVVDDGDRYVELCHALLREYDYATRCELPGPCWTCERRPGCTLTHAHDAAEADETLRRHRDVDVVLLDVAFDVPVERLLPSSEKNVERRRRLQGIEILAHLRRARGDLPVVLMTSESELAYQDAAEALAVDEFASLAGEAAFDARALSLLVERVLARREGSAEAGGYTWGSSPAMARLRRDVGALARTSLPILVLGEPGTGKSALAERVIHPLTRGGESGKRGPFVAVDLASIPETLIAAELFGTARGAFSGAIDRRGRFEEASGGTLFLDEIGNLPAEAQRMLLLALQDQRITRLGESSPRTVDVKLVAATNADLAARVRAGTFRADLYARLNPAARLVVPPLRERMDDLSDLARGLVKKKLAAGADRALLADYLDAAGLAGAPHAELHFGRPPKQVPRGVSLVLSKASVTELRRHAFPGNVRELELLVANAAVFTLADALSAAKEGRARHDELARILPIPEKLVRELLTAGMPTAPRERASRDRLALELRAAPTLHGVSHHLERQVYERLFAETNGDFEAMAERLLAHPGPTAARKVRLRFNQLGLKVRARSRRSDDS
jgi:two-component system nitrogen regulation response regulator GlnG